MIYIYVFIINNIRNVIKIFKNNNNSYNNLRSYDYSSFNIKHVTIILLYLQRIAHISLFGNDI